MSYLSDSQNQARFVPRVGAEIAGKYRIERKLGEGGMGVVVSAVHLSHGGRVALKFLVPGEGDRTDAITRLLREAQSAVRIRSEHVAKVLDVGTLEQGDPYIVMELLEGSDLNKVVRSRGPLPIAEAVEFVLQASEAVADAHAQGIVHRDLKPANLFLTQRPDGSPFVKVLDFGIAKNLRKNPEAAEMSLTVGGDVLGSPLYMSPEQIRNPKTVDPRADVWSLGAILYKLLTGRAAFEADNPSASLAMIISEEPTPMSHFRRDVPPALSAIVAKCLCKRLDLRFQSVDEVACALLPFAPVRPRGRPWVPTMMTAEGMPMAEHGPAMMLQTGGMMPMTQAPMVVPVLPPGETTMRASSRRTAAYVAAGAGALVVLGGLLVLGFVGRGGASGADAAGKAPLEAPTKEAGVPLGSATRAPLPAETVAGAVMDELAMPSQSALQAPSAAPSATAPSNKATGGAKTTKRKTSSDALDDRL